jgi:hypothetical protein
MGFSQQNADVKAISEKNRNTGKNIVHNILNNNQYHINIIDWIDRAKAKRKDTIQTSRNKSRLPVLPIVQRFKHFIKETTAIAKLFKNTNI